MKFASCRAGVGRLKRLFRRSSPLTQLEQEKREAAKIVARFLVSEHKPHTGSYSPPSSLDDHAHDSREASSLRVNTCHDVSPVRPRDNTVPNLSAIRGERVLDLLGPDRDPCLDYPPSSNKGKTLLYDTDAQLPEPGQSLIQNDDLDHLVITERREWSASRHEDLHKHRARKGG